MLVRTQKIMSVKTIAVKGINNSYNMERRSLHSASEIHVICRMKYKAKKISIIATNISLVLNVNIIKN